MDPQKEFLRIKGDRISGSTEITMETCELIEKALSSGISHEKLEKMLADILNAHRPMALLHSCIEHFLKGGDVHEFVKNIERNTRNAGKNAEKYLEERGIESVLTLSSSSAVEDALSSFRGRIYVMESRPMLEGTGMAERLAEKGRGVTVLTDAYGISMVARGEVGAVIVGVDALYRNMLINKVGTYPLSVAAEKGGIEFIAVMITEKILPSDIELSGEEIMQFHNPAEITEDLRAINAYFEATEITERMKVFTEKGLLKTL